ncbi:MAG: hypothetical protein AAGJ18_10720 [Bacteroidota bacterium]
MKSLQMLLIISMFVWIGFLGAISFMEAWLKFRAPGITQPLGLGIGKLAFRALNKVETLLAIFITVSLLKLESITIKQRLIITVPITLPHPIY